MPRQRLVDRHRVKDSLTAPRVAFPIGALRGLDAGRAGAAAHAGCAVAGELSVRGRLVRRFSGHAAVGPVRPGGRPLRRSSLPGFLGQGLELRADRPPGRSRRGRPAGPGRRRRHQGRPVPAEYPLLRDLLLRGAQGRRHRGQLQSALCRARDRAPDRGFRDRPHGHPRPRAAAAQARADAGAHPAEGDHRRQDGGYPALSQEAPVPPGQGARDREGARTTAATSGSTI